MRKNSLILSILFVTKHGDSKYTKDISSKYDCKIVHSIKSMDRAINSSSPDIIVLDNNLISTKFDEGLVRISTVERMIHIILLVDYSGDAVPRLSLGITDFFVKPVIPDLLLAKINAYMQFIQDIKLSTRMNVKIHDKLKEKSVEIIRLQTSVIGVLSEAIEFRDFDTETHNLRTQRYAEILIRKLLEEPNKYQREVSLWDIDNHILASQLHDIGKISIPNEILLKEDPLTEEEFNKIKEHVNIGVKIIDKILKRYGSNTYLEIAKIYIESHHEYWNGHGYPNHLSGTSIPLEGRILAIIDVYDAITAARPYKHPKSHVDAVAMINAQSGIQFDPEIVRIFNMVSNQFRKITI